MATSGTYITEVPLKGAAEKHYKRWRSENHITPSATTSKMFPFTIANGTLMVPSRFETTLAVKDLRMGDTLVQRKANEGVYDWPFAKITALSSIKNNRSDWHACLGHPNSQVLNYFLSNFGLSVSNSAFSP